jgi:hypothetical protein
MLEQFIEQAIALLDGMDGDPDLEETGDMEPSFGSPSLFSRDKMEEDLEDDTSDSELSLGWTNPDGPRLHVPEEAALLMSGLDGE